MTDRADRGDESPGIMRCPRCALQSHACLCDALRPLALETRVIVLRHRRERFRTSNTGRLVPLILARGEVQVYGELRDVLDTTSWRTTDRTALLLFPSEDSVELTRATADGRPVTLIVPDANWRRAYKLAKRERALEGIRRVHVPVGPASRYRLRRHPDPRFLATFEAVARALGILEGPAVQAHLEHVFDLFVERTLQSRGRPPLEGFGRG